MAKGRRLTSSRSERLLGSYGHGYGYGADGSEAAEFDEDDVWSAVDHGGGAADGGEDGAENSQLGWAPRAPEEGGGGGGGGGRSGGQGRVPRGGLSLAFEDSGVRPSPRIVHQFRGNDAVASSSPRGHGHGHGHGHHMATSAPVNVPDWSKIYRVDSVESMHDSDDGLEEGGDSEMVPPHEYLAREYARSHKAAATSVFEGVGRTLKGRDMRRMRDAVWSQTGFDG